LLGNDAANFGAGRPSKTGAIFAHSKPIRAEPLSSKMRTLSLERRFIMDYVIVFVTMAMIVGYACLIGRVLRGTE
jgi:hypothetical protein